MDAYTSIKQALIDIGEGVSFSLTQPELPTHGDYSSNLAFALAKKKGVSVNACAEELTSKLSLSLSSIIDHVEIAGPGFINFFLIDSVRTKVVDDIARQGVRVASRQQKVLVEYTDPNCFKVFHIGHVMANTVGEAISRLYETQGFDVVRVCYPSDIGRNVAMGVWGVIQKENEKPNENASMQEKIAFLGSCYAYANTEFETNEEAKRQIIEVNKAIYSRSDEKIVRTYEEGRALSLLYFDSLYKKLGTSFDAFIYESEVSDEGSRIVKEYLKHGLFEVSEGAVVYKGENDGLHTRVFMNKEGLPTYEAKDLGNYARKIAMVPDAFRYVVITASEQNEYFKVVNTVAQKIYPSLQDKLVHVSHGMMRLTSGKMSSRTGNVIGGEELLHMIGERIAERVKEMRVNDEDKEHLMNDIAVGAIKFSVLKIAPGKDIVFDFEKSISFEGDSGPYLQYTHARLRALLDRAQENDITFTTHYTNEIHEVELERAIMGYKEVTEKAYHELGPHHIVQHLLLLTRAFNALYGRVQIVDAEHKEESAYYCMLAHATKNILAHGLHVLGIVAPERM